MLTCLSLAAQDSQYPWEFGIRLGTSSIGGDMIENDIIFLNQAKFSAGLSLRRRLGTTFALRASFDYGTLSSDDAKADDASQVARGWKSEATIIEPSLSLEFEPFAGKRFSNGTFKRILSPYISAGVGYGIWGEVDTDFNGASNPNIIADQQENLDDVGGVVFPVGGGLKWYVSRKSSLGIDFAYRITGADLIDGVSQSGNPAKDDSYIFTGLTFATGFGKKDTDKDGIFDEDDACPTEPGPASTMGCPDRDGDGVADKDDACPDVAGLASLMGCPDGDGDGVPDKDDDCPTEPGTAALNGCPDSDGDGVADKDDECPTEAGVAALNGCPDGDGDGVADKDDECPTEPGTAANRGCPDTDGDGIIDKEDECPTVAGVASRNGCPEPSERPENLDERIARYRALLDGQNFKHIRVDTVTGTIAIDRIYFPTDVSSLNRPDRVIIEEIDRFLKLPGASDFSIRYEGHADRRASEEYNQALSERRAGSAESYTASKGAPADKLSQIGFGENRPVGETLSENRVVIPVATEPTRMISGN